jgi:hypothetical protein
VEPEKVKRFAEVFAPVVMLFEERATASRSLNVYHAYHPSSIPCQEKLCLKMTDHSCPHCPFYAD